MSEKLSPSPEQINLPESSPEKSKAELEHKTEQEPDKGESPEKIKAKVEHLTQKVEQEAVSGKDVKVDSSESTHSQTVINKELKSLTFQRTLNRIRHRLSPPAKTFSKVVHQPVINKISEGAEKTVARPRGILLGGVLALVGSSVILFSAKHYGFGYNLSIFFILFIAGYLAATILEIVFGLLKKRR